MKFISNIKKNAKGFIALEIGETTVGQIIVDLSGNELKILDTVVPSSAYLYPFGKLLLHKIVEYARMHELKIVAVCKFAQQQFVMHPSLYAD